MRWRQGDQRAGAGELHAVRPGREAGKDWQKATTQPGGQVIGTKFVLYHETHSREKDKRIKLVK